MANRRMFSKSITNSGKFIKMPPTSRLLYYDLGMNADDDGYAEWFTVMRMSGSSEQDLKVLQANGFVYIFDDNVLVILDWHENNQLRKDRYSPSKYAALYPLATIGIPNGNQLEPQYSIGKDSIGKDSIGKDSIGQNISAKADKTVFGEFGKVKLTNEEHRKLIDRFGEKNTNILIFELDTYIASKGKKYSSHYATLLNWAKRKFDERSDKKFNVGTV